MLSAAFWWVSSLSLFVIGAVVCLFLRNRPHASNIIGHTIMFIGSTASFILGLKTLIGGEQLNILQLEWLPFAQFDLYVDGLGAFFVCVISLLSGLVSIYALGYTREYYGKYSVGWLTAMLNLFVFSMLLVTLADNAVVFLVAWELMALVSYFLVIFEQKGAPTTRAGFIYIVMTHLGTIAIMILFLVLFSLTGTFGFDGFKNSLEHLTPVTRNVIFVLALIGFGTKAGLVPLHVWLPVAHPTAPSHVSALMSGVMVKTAVYAFLRIMLPLGVAIPLWWGSLLIVVGLASAVFGVMYALVERDIKRLLAYSTVENMGLIFTGIGVLFVFKSLGLQNGAVLASMAIVLHIFNHSLFKGLLFMAAGSVVQATHIKNMDKLGGLIKKMPQTAVAFFIGAMAVAALPPLNGFISEWLLFQGLFQLGIVGRDTFLGILAPIGIALLGLVGALVSASMVKTFGAVFLGRSREFILADTVDASAPMRGAMFLGGGACLISGILAPVLLQYLNTTVIGLSGQPVNNFIKGNFLLTAPDFPSGALSPSGIALAIIMVLCAVLAVDRIWGRGTSVRVDETWGCGINLTPRMEYTGTSFSQPLKVIFRSIFMPERSLEHEYIGSPYFTRIIRYQGSVTPIFERFFYKPIHQYVLAGMQYLKGIQLGRLQFYLGYIFVTLVLLLLITR